MVLSNAFFVVVLLERLYKSTENILPCANSISILYTLFLVLNRNEHAHIYIVIIHIYSYSYIYSYNYTYKVATMYHIPLSSFFHFY